MERRTNDHHECNSTIVTSKWYALPDEILFQILNFEFFSFRFKLLDVAVMTDNLPEQEIQDTLFSQLPTLFVGIGITFLFTVINLGQCTPVWTEKWLFSVFIFLIKTFDSRSLRHAVASQLRSRWCCLSLLPSRSQYRPFSACLSHSSPLKSVNRFDLILDLNFSIRCCQSLSLASVLIICSLSWKCSSHDAQSFANDTNHLHQQ